ncbi:MAG: transposase [Bacteroidota bacterium]|jgi:transposase
MTGKSRLVDDETLSKAQSMLDRLGNEARGVIKLKAIISSKEHGISLVAKVFNVSRNSINTWIHKFKRDANSILSVDSGRGRKDRLTKEQLEIVKSWVLSNPNLTLQQLSQKIESDFNVKYTIPGVQKIMKKLSFSYITPRPKHYKQDKAKQDEFKKKSSNRNTKKP